MAANSINSLTLTTPSSSINPSSSSQRRVLLHGPLTRTRNVRLTIRATGPDMLGEMGARDPFPAELESNFGDKVLGNMCTEHKILIPNASALSLAQQTCSPISPTESPIPHDQAKQLLFKLVGWRLVEQEVLKLRCVWKLKDAESGKELIARIAKVAEQAGHLKALHVVEMENNQVAAELWTKEIGGLSFNDFIVADKIDQVKTSDLVPRKRVWA